MKKTILAALAAAVLAFTNCQTPAQAGLDIPKAENSGASFVSEFDTIILTTPTVFTKVPVVYQKCEAVISTRGVEFAASSAFICDTLAKDAALGLTKLEFNDYNYSTPLLFPTDEAGSDAPFVRRVVYASPDAYPQTVLVSVQLLRIKEDKKHAKESN